MARVPGRRDRRPGVHHRHRGRRRRAERDHDGGDGRRPVRHQPAASAARPHRPWSASQPVPAGHPAARRPPRPVSGSRPSPAHSTASRWPTSISTSVAREMCWASTSPGAPSTLRFLSLRDHLEIIQDGPRRSARPRYETEPARTRDGSAGGTVHRHRPRRIPGQGMTRRRVRWLAAAVALAVVVAIQVTTSTPHRSGRFVAAGRYCPPWHRASIVLAGRRRGAGAGARLRLPPRGVR